ncbi:hypothetical protein Sango_1361300 [Sesamum angolense]|uniref:Pentatricopeptide repeat-containing protein n=1 Tax=Sesamum angolense TaxID=2727404 RepID=A0AAE1WSJ4_9LAMI|nr:hypothetical protein Sango_1361300 [Sesamum angolense]
MVKMKEEGVQLDLMAYTVLIDGYGRAEFINLSFDTLKSMVDAGYEPSHYTYSVLIKHLSHEKLINGNSARIGLDPGANNGSINIADVWKITEHNTALRLFEKMKQHGCAPNINTYNALISGNCGEERLEETCRLVDHLKQCGMSPTEDICNRLVECCCKMRMYEEAMNLIDGMPKHGLLPHLECYKLLVCGLYMTREMMRRLRQPSIGCFTVVTIMMKWLGRSSNWVGLGEIGTVGSNPPWYKTRQHKLDLVYPLSFFSPQIKKMKKRDSGSKAWIGNARLDGERIFGAAVKECRSGLG